MNEVARSTPSRKQMKRLLQDIASTNPDELSEEEANEKMLRCVEKNFNDEQIRQRFPDLWHYFAVNPTARDEFDLLKDIAHADQTGELSLPAHIPPPPTISAVPKSSLWEQVRDTLNEVFGGFSTEFSMASATRGDQNERGELQPTELHASVIFSQKYQIIFALLPKRETSFTLKIAVKAMQDREIEYMPVRLKRDEYTILENELNITGVIICDHLPPGVYTFEMISEQHTYRVNNIKLQ